MLSVLSSAIWWSPFLLVGALVFGGGYAALVTLVAIIGAIGWALQRHFGQQQQIRQALQEADSALQC